MINISKAHRSPYQGPRTRPVTGITIHHWGIDGQKAANVARYLCNNVSKSSAHYVAAAGEIYELVPPNRRANHAGPGNQPTIGIECRPEATPADRETIAQLIAHLWKQYPVLVGKDLIPHRAWLPTNCPGRYMAHLTGLKARAAQIHGGKALPAKPAVVKPAAKAADIPVDGYFGPATARRLQQIVGTPSDGVISGQVYKPRACPSWRLGKGGSISIRKVQAALGIPADGYCGTQTVKAWQTSLGTTPDGVISDGGRSQFIRALQQALNAGRFK